MHATSRMIFMSRNWGRNVNTVITPMAGRYGISNTVPVRNSRCRGRMLGLIALRATIPMLLKVYKHLRRVLIVIARMMCTMDSSAGIARAAITTSPSMPWRSANTVAGCETGVQPPRDYLT